MRPTRETGRVSVLLYIEFILTIINYINCQVYITGDEVWLF